MAPTMLHPVYFYFFSISLGCFLGQRPSLSGPDGPVLFGTVKSGAATTATAGQRRHLHPRCPDRSPPRGACSFRHRRKDFIAVVCVVSCRVSCRVCSGSRSVVVVVWGGRRRRWLPRSQARGVRGRGVGRRRGRGEAVAVDVDHVPVGPAAFVVEHLVVRDRLELDALLRAVVRLHADPRAPAARMDTR